MGRVLGSGICGQTNNTGKFIQTKLYRTYQRMVRRCENVKDDSYRFYGARGIRVCPEWRSSFAAFKSWAESHRYADDLTIDRIDSTKDYSPSNCRWVTGLENYRYKSSTKLSLEIADEIKRLRASGVATKEIAEKFGINNSSIYQICKGTLWVRAKKED